MSDQLALAYEDRHTGQAANLAAATTVHRDDRARVEHAVAELARAGQPFTADTVHARLGTAEPYDRNLVSSVLGVWAQQGRIVEDRDQRPTASKARTRHASRNRWWTGGANVPEARHVR
jgi:hypothetical protein